jgi:hypothetical protein
MKINLRVTFNDETVEQVSATARDLVAFEEKYSRSVAKMHQEMKLTDLLFIAWNSLQRTNKTKKDFETWLDDVEGIEASDDDPKLSG